MDSHQSDSLADIFDSSLNLEKTHFDEGFKEGYNDGLASGKEEGRQVGLKHGFETGEELGFYRGCIDVWTSAIWVDLNCFSSRIQKSIKTLDELLRTYPVLDPENESVNEIMDSLRLNFSSKMLKLHPSMMRMMTRTGPLLTRKDPVFRQINQSFSPIYLGTNPSSCSRLTLCFSHTPKNSSISRIEAEETPPVIANKEEEEENEWRTEKGSPTPSPQRTIAPRLSMTDQAFFLFAFIACTTSVAFTSLVIAAVPTLHAMGRAAISLSKLADTAREDLPGTMVAIRLSGMEISDLTLELSDLSQEIAEGVNKSAQAVQAAEAGIRQIGSRARQQTMSMIEERANLPTLSLQPVVVGAAKKTSRAVGQATKAFMNMISRGEGSSDDENANAIERLEI